MALLRVFTICGLAFLCQEQAFSQEKKVQSDEFLYAVIELHRTDGSEDYVVEFKTTKVINQKLRIPSKSERINTDLNNYVRFEITDDGLNALDEIIINDPFNVEYEYVDEQGKLQHKVVVQDDRSILIRRPISEKATSIVVRPSSNQRSSQSSIFKFR